MRRYHVRAWRFLAFALFFALLCVAVADRTPAFAATSAPPAPGAAEGNAKPDTAAALAALGDAVNAWLRAGQTAADALARLPGVAEALAPDLSPEARADALLRLDAAAPSNYCALLLPSGAASFTGAPESCLMVSTQENHAWSQAVKADRYAGRSVHGPYTSLAGGRYVLFSAPVARNGVALGLAVSAVNVAELEKDLEAERARFGGLVTHVLNARGDAVIAPDSVSTAGDVRFLPLLRAMKEEERGTLKHSWQNINYLSSYETLEGSGWIVVASRRVAPEEASFPAWIAAPAVVLGAALLAALFLLLRRLFAMSRAHRSLQDESRSLLRDLRQTEDNWAIEHERTQVMLRATSEAIFVMDTQGRILTVNDAMLRCLRYDAEADVVGRSAHELFHHTREDGSPYPVEECPLFTAICQGSSASMSVTTLWRKDGTHFLATARIMPLRRNNELVGAVGVFLDVTEMHAREAIRQAVFSASTDAYLIFDDSLAVEDVNPTGLRLFNVADFGAFKLGVEQNRLLRAAAPGEDALWVAARKALDRGKERREITLLDANGEEIPCEISMVRVDLGHKRAVFANIHDLRIVRRTESALMEARDAAEEANRAKSDFLARMSHEIRTPMNAIMGMAHLCLQTRLTIKQRNYLAKIQEASHSLLSMVNDILDFSKTGSESMALEVGSFRMDALLDALAVNVAPRAEKKGLTFLIRLDPRLPQEMVGDSLRLSQVLQALAGNAVKFTERGEVVVRADLENQDENSVLVHFRVSDTGIGMSHEQMSKLFLPFSQADDSSTRRFGGAGLGLAIGKSLVELMGGQIWVESDLGAGSVFHLTLRFAKEGATLPAPAAPRDFSQLNALVVDDNAVAADVMAEQLASLGLRAETVLSGREALERLEHAQRSGTPFDVLILDWKMPDLDGLETAHLVRTSFPPERTPIMILVSAAVMDMAYDTLEQHGIRGWLPKPLSPHLLRETLARLLTEADGTFPAADHSGPDPSAPNLSAPNLSAEEAAFFAGGGAAKAAAGPATASDPRGARILLVEDNEINQEIAVSLLEDEGLSVDVASDGAEAVAMVRDHGANHYQLVFMDIQMPVMDGLEAARSIRSMGFDRDALPIVAMTAHAQSEDREKSLGAGMNDHITKPLDPAELQKTLRHWIRMDRIDPEQRNAATMDMRDKEREAALLASPGLAGDMVDPSPVLSPTEGLEHVGGNRALYAKLLRKFRESGRATAQEIRQALLADDQELAVRLAHTTKGVSASLGLLLLSRVAAILEKTLKEQASLPDLERALLPEFASELQRALTAADNYLREEGLDAGVAAQGRPPATPSRQLPPQTAAQALWALHDLEEHLESDWGRVMDKMDEVADLLSGTSCSSSLYDLSVAVENFDIAHVRLAAHLLEDQCRVAAKAPA